MKYFLAFLCIGGCTPTQIEIFEEAAESELQIIERVIEKESGVTPPAPKT
jgi:hypothetical protein